jgi:hypothetical protein
MLNVSITGLACVETTTNPLLEEEYLVLHATSTATEIRTAIPKSQVNLVRILLFISCRHTAATPGSPKPGRNAL